MTKSITTLNDKYTLESGRVFMSSVQALVRLPIDQVRRDRKAGLATTGFISGYRGSPLGTYDAALWGAGKLLKEYDIRFEPGLNEELAATSMRGTQELEWFGESKYQGAFGLWYGKGLGVDRACESLKLGNLEGASRHGGVLVVAGDDHGGKSSASAHQSEHTLIAGFIPILYPSTTQEILEFGIFGWQMSRFTGLWVGLKCITDTLDLTASIALPDAYRPFVAPPDFRLPREGLNIQALQSPLAQEDWVVNRRLPVAPAYARANGIDRVVLDGHRRTLAIVTAGKAYLDVRQALADLGLDEARCRALGIRLYKPGLTWPLDREGAVAFAAGSQAVLVVEEKRPLIEEQLVNYLYGLDADRRPRLAGKRDFAGQPLLPLVGELSAAPVRRAIKSCLDQLALTDADLADRFDQFEAFERRSSGLGSGTVRPAFFCSGCPHNTSTRIPDGSMAMSAVGCHGLVAYVMPDRPTLRPMPMGGDGMPWVSAGPLVEMPHIFQNMGDGTYAHSGILAIRAAVAAKSNMTYKILYNDAVAMTGGQPVEGAPSPVDIVRQLLAEGVEPVVLVSDQPQKFAAASVPAGVTVNHRDDLDRIQRSLREVKGVSAIVYEQTCATEKRRRRKRGTFPDPDKRVVINPEVCEGCGDCSVQSNCVSVQPLETEFGRKRQIDQSTCNKDFSCLKGFCPSFVTLEGAKVAAKIPQKDTRIDALIAALPEPPLAPLEAAGYNILVAGIGGTGVLTVGALLGMAAHLEGKGCTILDLTGMAQKGGAVTSHVRIAAEPGAVYNSRLGAGMADLLVACDMVVGSGQDVVKTLRPGRTRAVVNLDVSPTGDFQTRRDFVLDENGLADAIGAALGTSDYFRLHGTKLATELTGDSIATNVLMLGYAAQKGLLPVSIASLEEAIRLNGTFVSGNLRTLALGRIAAQSPEVFAPATEKGPDLTTLDGLLASRIRRLTDYQDIAYAKGYEAFVRAVEQRLAARGLDGDGRLIRTIANTLARLMAYKDEYEVARLHTDPAFWAHLRSQFSGDFKVTFHLAPPLLPGEPDHATGRPRKRPFGPWMLPVFRVLKRFKVLRGTAFDPFGHTRERRMERRLITDYRTLIDRLVDRVTPANLDAAVALAAAAADIRGYGPVKDESLRDYEKALDGRLAALDPPPPPHNLRQLESVAE